MHSNALPRETAPLFAEATHGRSSDCRAAVESPIHRRSGLISIGSRGRNLLDHPAAHPRRALARF